jgi:hypothetical protein
VSIDLVTVATPSPFGFLTLKFTVYGPPGAFAAVSVKVTGVPRLIGVEGAIVKV